MTNYFMNTKYTARMRHANAAAWFQCSCSPWKSTPAMTVNTMSDITSCITFSCMSVKGPPLPTKPILLAGTCREYSARAMSHEKRMTPYSNQGNSGALPIQEHSRRNICFQMLFPS